MLILYACFQRGKTCKALRTSNWYVWLITYAWVTKEPYPGRHLRKAVPRGPRGPPHPLQWSVSLAGALHEEREDGLNRDHSGVLVRVWLQLRLKFSRFPGASFLWTNCTKQDRGKIITFLLYILLFSIYYFTLLKKHERWKNCVIPWL